MTASRKVLLDRQDDGGAVNCAVPQEGSIPTPRPEVVVGFPAAKEITEEEQAKRIMAEAKRLANLAPGEWKIWAARSAERVGISRADLEHLVKAQLKEKEKKEREAKAKARRMEQRAEKQRKENDRKREREEQRLEKEAERKSKLKLKEFAAIQKLPTTEREAKLAELATRLDEDVEFIREEFSEFVGVDTHADPALEPWPEPVPTEALLCELMMQLRRYSVISDEGGLAVVLWTAMAWLHNEIATHSPILVITSAEEDSGKSTTLGVLERLTPCAYWAVELTGPNVYHIVDQFRPTLIIDEADNLFKRKADLMHIVNQSWLRGAKIPRLVGGVSHGFHVFCPKVFGMKGFDLPSTTASRAIVVKLWPKLPDETIEDFHFGDDDTFVTLRRKLLRWKMDSATALKAAAPVVPAGFNNRLRANWRLLLAIADSAARDFAERARAAAVRLSRKPHQPSEGRRLLEAAVPIVRGREFIASKELRAGLTADPTADWRDFRNKGPISEKQISVLLAPYDIFPDVYHPTKRATDTKRGYVVAQFEHAFAHFLPSEPYIRTLPAR
jgi:putative DNA primase/helicase